MSIVYTLHAFMKHHLDVSEITVLILLVLCAIAFPLSSLLYPTTESFWINLGGFLVSLLALIGYYWNRECFHYYWLIFLVYVFSFNFTYNYFLHMDSIAYATGITIMLMAIPILVADVLISVIIISVGAVLGFLLSDVNFTHVYNHLFDSELLYAYILSFLMSLGLMKGKGKNFSNKIKTILAISSSIAHEIKTPITSIKLHNDELKSLVLNTKEDNIKILRTTTKVIDHQLKNIVNTTDFLLLNARFGHVKNKIQLKKESLYDCIEHVLKEYPYQNRIGQKDIFWQKSIDCIFLGDKTLMCNILFNLIKNAIHSILNKGSGHIYLSNFQDKKFNYLIVRDTGMGVKKKHLKKLCNSFFTSNDSGSGLGLFFCKNIVTQFEGKINISSVYKEHFTVTIKLPICQN